MYASASVFVSIAPRRAQMPQGRHAGALRASGRRRIWQNRRELLPQTLKQFRGHHPQTTPAQDKRRLATISSACHKKGEWRRPPLGRTMPLASGGTPRRYHYLLVRAQTQISLTPAYNLSSDSARYS